MNSKRKFLKKILSLFLVTIFPYQIIKKSKKNKKIFKKQFSKIWILTSDDI